MAANTYDIGDVVRLDVAFTTQADVAVDPGTITVKIKNPIGTVTTYVYGVDAEVIRDSTGNYYVLIDADKEGVWYYRWEGTGANQSADEDTFTVADSQFY